MSAIKSDCSVTRIAFPRRRASLTALSAAAPFPARAFKIALKIRSCACSSQTPTPFPFAALPAASSLHLASLAPPVYGLKGIRSCALT